MTKNDDFGHDECSVSARQQERHIRAYTTRLRAVYIEWVEAAYLPTCNPTGAQCAAGGWQRLWVAWSVSNVYFVLVQQILAAIFTRIKRHTIDASARVELHRDPWSWAVELTHAEVPAIVVVNNGVDALGGAEIVT